MNNTVRDGNHHDHDHDRNKFIGEHLDFLCHDPAVSFLRVIKEEYHDEDDDVDDPLSSSTPQQEPSVPLHRRRQRRQLKRKPKILCLVLTQGSSHPTRLQAIWDTWGSKCDHFMAASDTDDPSLHAYRIQSESGYWGIWDKLMQSLRIVLQKQQKEVLDFDWILKADDDTYVIMENLRSFLVNTTTDNDDDDEEEKEETHPRARPAPPLIYGRTMPWPRLIALKTFMGWFETPRAKAFGDRFYAKFPNKNQRLIYAHGGPGYVMNPSYVKILTEAYFHNTSSPSSSVEDEGDRAVHGRVSEDLANAVTMLYNRNMTPYSTMDMIEQKERSHPESPRTMYNNPKWLPWIQENIQHRGDGSDCCSSTSISYHHVNHREMRLLHYQLYECPKR